MSCIMCFLSVITKSIFFLVMPLWHSHVYFKYSFLQKNLFTAFNWCLSRKFTKICPLSFRIPPRNFLQLSLFFFAEFRVEVTHEQCVISSTSCQCIMITFGYSGNSSTCSKNDSLQLLRWCRSGIQILPQNSTIPQFFNSFTDRHRQCEFF